jgi:hypothetical protein
MSHEDDFTIAVQSTVLDGISMDDFVTGTAAPDDVPPALREVASLIRAARPPASVGALGAEKDVVDAFLASARRAPACGSARTLPFRRKIKPAHAAVALAVATVALGGAAAAAATGAFPASIQSVVARAASHLGISLPMPKSNGSTVAKHTVVRVSHPSKQPVVRSKSAALCTTYAAFANEGTVIGDPSPGTSKIFAELAMGASEKHDSVQRYCASAVPGSRSGSVGPSGQSHRPVKAGNPHGRSGGKPTSPPGRSHRPAKAGNPHGRSGGKPTSPPGRSHRPAKAAKPHGRSGRKPTSPPGRSHRPAKAAKPHGRSGGKPKSPPGRSHRPAHGGKPPVRRRQVLTTNTGS